MIYFFQIDVNSFRGYWKVFVFTARHYFLQGKSFSLQYFHCDQIKYYPNCAISHFCNICFFKFEEFLKSIGWVCWDERLLSCKKQSQQRTSDQNYLDLYILPNYMDSFSDIVNSSWSTSFKLFQIMENQTKS